jgi:alpha-tubulin suppressor-like RCC1 family protein
VNWYRADLVSSTVVNHDNLEGALSAEIDTTIGNTYVAPAPPMASSVAEPHGQSVVLSMLEHAVDNDLVDNPEAWQLLLDPRSSLYGTLHHVADQQYASEYDNDSLQALCKAANGLAHEDGFKQLEQSFDRSSEWDDFARSLVRQLTKAYHMPHGAYRSYQTSKHQCWLLLRLLLLSLVVGAVFVAIAFAVPCDLGPEYCEQGPVCNPGTDSITKTLSGSSCFDCKFGEATESDVDCGGNCRPCTVGKTCASDADCDVDAKLRCVTSRVCSTAHLRASVSPSAHPLSPTAAPTIDAASPTGTPLLSPTAAPAMAMGTSNPTSTPSVSPPVDAPTAVLSTPGTSAPTAAPTIDAANPTSTPSVSPPVDAPTAVLSTPGTAAPTNEPAEIPSTAPTELTLDDGVILVEICLAGGNNNLCHKTDGTWVVWGGNARSQLGLSDSTERTTPTATTALGTDIDIKTCTTAPDHTLCRKTDGTWLGWGWVVLAGGRLGTTPTAITAFGTDVETCVTGVSYTLCRKTDGTWVAFGYNNHGQLGLGDWIHRTTPETATTITALGTDVETCAACGSHNLCRKTDGTWLAFGSNNNGQLGLGDNGDLTDRNTPTAITALGTDIEACVAGNSHNLCRKTDGTWVAFGSNSYGQLGLGDTNPRNMIHNTPTAITALGTDAETCIAGVSYTLCRKTNGTWLAFGSNSYGQLRLGDTNPRNTPTAITALGTDVETCVAGNYHNLCRKTDGTWLGWGYNFYNQLGLGDGGHVSSNRDTPTVLEKLGSDSL